MKSLKGTEPPDYIPPEEYDDLMEKETRTPEEELKVDAYDKKVPFNQIDNYVAFYSLKKPDDYPDISFYEDDFFLMENPEFYKEVYQFLFIHLKGITGSISPISFKASSTSSAVFSPGVLPALLLFSDIVRVHIPTETPHSSKSGLSNLYWSLSD